LGGIWQGFTGAGTFQYSTGRHAHLPVGYWESSWLMLQVNFVRLVAGGPLLFLVVAVTFTPKPLPWAEAWAYTWRVFLVLLAIQPVWCMVAFSRSTNDTSSRWWFSALLFFGMLGGLFTLVVGAVAMFGLSETGPALALGGVLIGCFLLLWLGYGLAHRFGVFDLMKLNR
jgi:hypothetical protein